MKKRDIVIAVGITVFLAVLFLYSLSKNKPLTSSAPQVSLESRLNECGSLPNGSVQQVTDTTRMFVNIPKDYYPSLQLQIDQLGATAGYVSNAGQYGNAFGANNDPNCWSYYFEFDGSGTVDITSKSGVASVPDYHVRFVVSSTTPQ